MTWQRDLVSAYRDHGLVVVEGPNWEQFGVGDWAQGRPVAALTHQFVISYDQPDSAGVDMLTHGYDTGTYFLNPPVANCYLGAAGAVYMIGGRVAQHAGTGVLSVMETAAGDRPPCGNGQDAPGPDNWADGSFYYWGRETHHPGDMTPYRQYGFLVTMCAAECELFGWSANRQLEHSNASQRKAQDLVSIDGNQLRRDIATAMRAPSIPQRKDDDDVMRLIRQDDTGAIYAFGPGVFVHIDTPEEVKVGQDAGLYSCEVTETNARGIDVLHEACMYAVPANNTERLR